MIDRHYTLSCYALERPYQAYYCQRKEIIELIDINNDIYQFRLPDFEHYEKLQANWKVQQYYRFDNITFVLYQTNDFFILKNQEAPSIIENVGQIGIFVSNNAIYFFLKYHEQQGNQNTIARAIVLKNDEKLSNTLQLKKWELQRVGNEHHENLNEVNCTKIEYYFSEFCIMKTVSNKNIVGRLNLENTEQFSLKLKYEIVDIDLPKRIEIIGSYQNTLIFVSCETPSQKQLNSKVCYFLNAEFGICLPLQGLNLTASKLDYLLYGNFLVLIAGQDILFYEILRGSFITRINITVILEEFDVGSSIILGAQHEKQARYSMLFDKLSSKVNGFYLIDKEKLTVYHFNIKELLNNAFINTMKINLQELSSDPEQVHDNVMKTLNFRMKKLKTLEQYIAEGIRTFSFGNSYRFLQNEQNLFVLSDGMYLLFNAIQNNEERIVKDKNLVLQIQRQMVKIAIKLITESKYQDHIVKGLTVANNFYNSFRNKSSILAKNDNSEVYHRLLETKRVLKLLKQNKNKQLFELSYQLAIAVKGYEYLGSSR